MDEKQKSLITRQNGMAPVIPLGANTVTFLISGEETGGSFSLTEFDAAPPPAPAAPLHIHYDADETIYVLSGEFQVTFGEQVVAVYPGASIFVPSGNPHTIANIGTNRGKILVFLTPPGFEGYWNEMSQLMQRSGGPVDPEVALATQAKYHVDMLGQARRFVER
jgi:mannose-6-phosphate isomerase-like protein (cupin superfamily)